MKMILFGVLILTNCVSSGQNELPQLYLQAAFRWIALAKENKYKEISETLSKTEAYQLSLSNKFEILEKVVFKLELNLCCKENPKTSGIRDFQII